MYGEVKMGLRIRVNTMHIYVVLPIQTSCVSLKPWTRKPHRGKVLFTEIQYTAGPEPVQGDLKHKTVL